MTHKISLLLAIIITSSLVFPGIAVSQCGPPSITRDNVFVSIIKARNALDTYDSYLENIKAVGTSEVGWSWANELRGDVLDHAITAYYFGGAMAYPADPVELMKFLDATPPPELKMLEYPDNLESLVESGIISHLPVSPYETGRYLLSLPETPEAGDIYYSPIKVENAIFFLEPGHNEGNIVVIFDYEYEENQSVISWARQEEEFAGDLEKFLPKGTYNTISFIAGGDPDTW